MVRSSLIIPTVEKYCTSSGILAAFKTYFRLVIRFNQACGAVGQTLTIGKHNPDILRIAHTHAGKTEFAPFLESLDRFLYVINNTCGNPSTKIWTEDPTLGSLGPLFLKLFPPRPLPLDPPPPLPPLDSIICLLVTFEVFSASMHNDLYTYHHDLGLFLQSLEPPFPFPCPSPPFP